MLDFPSSPSVGQLYPNPAIAGVPVYRWDGTVWTNQGVNAPGVGLSGQGLFKFVSTTQCILVPRNGIMLKINGTYCVIPAAGVPLSNSGLAASTLYYAYAVGSAGAVTGLEFSATGHSTSSTSGNTGTEIKTGDDTRSLVGMVYTRGDSTFSDDTINRLVRSWFNDFGISGHQTISGAATVTSTGSFVELGAGDCRVAGLFWLNEQFKLEVKSSAYNGAAGNSVLICPWMDAGSIGQAQRVVQNTANWHNSMSAGFSGVITAEGMHLFSAGGIVGGSTGYYENRVTEYITVRHQ